MSLTISSGLWKGRKIRSPDCARPTTSRARLAIFNSLQNYINSLDNSVEILDLCAGSGLLSFECMSRLKLAAKPAKATFVDIDKTSCDVIRENVQNLDICDHTEIINSNALHFVQKEKFQKKKNFFDFIFLDPPYNEINLLKNIISTIDKHCVLKGLMVIDTDPIHEKEILKLLDIIKNTIFWRMPKRYSGNLLTILQRFPENSTLTCKISKKHLLE